MSTLDSTSKSRFISLDIEKKTEELREENIALEAPITIYLNDEKIVTLFASPTSLEELTIGYLLDQGILRNIDEIRKIVISGNEVKVETISSVSDRVRDAETFKVVTSACGSTEDFYRVLDQVETISVASNYSVSVEDLVSTVRDLNLRSNKSHLLAIHVSALYQNGSPVAYSEDVGRHNSIDKVIGFAAKSGLNFSDTILVTTGRQPADAVLKAARVGIPISVSIRDSIHSGVFAAWRARITLIGGARGPKMNIYTHPWRITYPFKSAKVKSISH